MRQRVQRIIFVFCLAPLIIMAGRQAQAALGESVDSVASDRKALSAVQRATTNRNGYSVRELASAANVVREYISPAGIIFAVAWNGLTHPDLTHLLGSYAAEFREALRNTPRKEGRRSHQVRANRVVVEKWGHMRNLRGRAYLPALIPPGVSVDEIK